MIRSRLRRASARRGLSVIVAIELTNGILLPYGDHFKGTAVPLPSSPTTQEPVMPEPDLSSPRARNLALLLLVMTQFVVVIDASITNVALPSIGKALDISQDDLSWVVNSYTLTFGGFLLLGGAGSPTSSAAGGCSSSACRFLGRLPDRRLRADQGVAEHRPCRRRASAQPSPRRRRSRSSPRPSPRAPSATARSASGARSPAPAEPPACCSAASSPR